MKTSLLIGLILIAVGVLDLGVGAFVAQRVRDPQKKLVLGVGIASGAVVMIGLGAAFAAGLIPFGG